MHTWAALVGGLAKAGAARPARRRSVRSCRRTHVPAERLPEAISSGVCPFPSIQATPDAAIAAIQVGIPVARIELLDEVQVRSCNTDAKLGLPESPMLFLEFHWSSAGVTEQSERHHVFWANKSFRTGAQVVVSDVCVPVSRLAECIVETKRDIERAELVAPIVGHAGDGNFHAWVLVMMNDADEVARARTFIERLAERALATEGTCTGEHGIGQGKKHFLDREHGGAAVEAMRAIKHALDPDRIMNPGKIV